jgi:hypothetical protein
MAAIAATAISAGLAGLAGLAAGPAHAAGTAAPGPATSSRPAAGPAATRYSIPGGLAGVAAASASDAWAVGYTGGEFSGKVLMLHWNGAKWSRVTSPKVLTGTGALLGITVVSAKDAWAVGFTGTYAIDRTLLLHWNGKTWSQLTSPKPIGGTLRAVTATASGGWAVGDAHPGGAGFYPLILRLTGTTWSRPKTAYGTHPDDDVILDGVALTPGSTAWAAGTTQETSGLARWNGKTWTSEYTLFPLPGQYYFTGIATGPVGTGFVVGSEPNSVASPTPFSARLTGTTWKKVTVSVPSNAQLNAVTFAPGGTAWAAGAVGTRALMVRWTGSAWARITSPSPGSRSAIAGLGFSASNYGWAVGTSGPDTLILHWNGKTWS